MKQITFKKLDLVPVQNYEGPLVEISYGFGYYSRLMSTRDGSQIQCAICGELFVTLQNHVEHTHDMSLADYRKEFEFASNTPLVAPNYLKKLRVGVKNLSFLTKEQRRKLIRKAYLANIRKNGKKAFSHPISPETKLKRGIAAVQLLGRVKKCADELGFTPLKSQFIDWCGTQKYIKGIYREYGTWKKCLQVAKIPLRTPKSKEARYTRTELIKFLKDFKKKYSRVPIGRDFGTLLPPEAAFRYHFGSIFKARTAAGMRISKNSMKAWRDFYTVDK